MPVKVTNKTQYPTREVNSLVRRTLREMDCYDVEVTVRHRSDGYTTGRYYPYYYPERGQRAHQILIRLPRPGVELRDYIPYSRTREEGKRFPLRCWKEALVAVVAHEGQHHKQERVYGKRRYKPEVECDLAAYRAWKRFTGE